MGSIKSKKLDKKYTDPRELWKLCSGQKSLIGQELEKSDSVTLTGFRLPGLKISKVRGHLEFEKV